jgi:heme oxygenase (biliverdin-IX-beta and delta-forming)
MARRTPVLQDVAARERRKDCRNGTIAWLVRNPDPACSAETDSMPANTRRFRLRERTSRAHASLDRRIGQFRSLADYERYIVGIIAFRIPLEERLAATDLPDIFGHWRPLLIGQALRADAIDLRLAPFVVADIARLPQDTESLLGTLYVLEGSALGARILYQRAQTIWLDELFGARHLALQSGAPDNWRKFLAVLEQHEPVEFESIVAASNAVFSAAERAFTGFPDVDPQPA